MEKYEGDFKVGDIIELNDPVKWRKEGEDVEILEVTIERKPTAKDFKDVKPANISFGDLYKVYAKIIGQSVTFVERMSAADMMKGSEVVNSLLPDSP